MYLFFSQRDKEFRIVFYSTLLYKYVWNSVQTLEFLSCPVMKCYVYNQLCFPSYSYVGIGGVFGLPRWLSGNDCLPMQGDGGLILGLGRSTGEGSGNPLQYSCLKNSIDREAWWTTVHGTAESDTTECLCEHAHTHIYTHTNTQNKDPMCCMVQQQQKKIHTHPTTLSVSVFL